MYKALSFKIFFLAILQMSFALSLNAFNIHAVNSSNASLPKALTSNQACSFEEQKVICIKTIGDLRKNILAVLDQLYRHSDYWQQAQYRPFGYFVEKGPLVWLFGKNQKDAISSLIDILNHEIIRNTHYLGLINDLEQELATAAEHTIQQLIKTTAWQTDVMLNLIEIDQLAEYTPQDDTNLDALLLNNQEKVKTYKKNAIKLFKHAQMPGHLQRHWLGYSISTTLAFLGLTYYLNNKNQIAQWIDEAKVASNNFYTNYIATPIKNSLDIIYRKKEDDPLITQEQIKTDEKIWHAEIYNYLKDRKKYYKKYKKYDDQELDVLALESVKTGILPQEIIDDYIQEVNNPTWNSLFGQIIRLTDITRIQPIQIKAEKSLLQGQHLIKANELNFELLVALPATALVGLASYLSYKSIKGIYHWVSPKKEFLYKPIKQALITIETILNTHIHEPLSYAIKGQLYYWHNQLSRAIPLIPLTSRAKFAADLASLVSTDLDTTQKLNTVQRMFRAHEFLI